MTYSPTCQTAKIDCLVLRALRNHFSLMLHIVMQSSPRNKRLMTASTLIPNLAIQPAEIASRNQSSDITERLVNLSHFPFNCASTQVTVRYQNLSHLRMCIEVFAEDVRHSNFGSLQQPALLVHWTCLSIEDLFKGFYSCCNQDKKNGNAPIFKGIFFSFSGRYMLRFRI